MGDLPRDSHQEYADIVNIRQTIRSTSEKDSRASLFEILSLNGREKEVEFDIRSISDRLQGIVILQLSDLLAL